MSLYWISWYQPTEDYRPLGYPPNEAVLGWWCSGSRCSDDAATLCAYVHAGDEKAAKEAVLRDWPEATEWRFCEPREAVIESSRFPLEDWMRERMSKQQFAK
jgi:hypothetical protein